MDVIMHEWKKRRLFLVLISALVALAVIIAALVLILGNRDAQNPGKTESSQWIPEEMCIRDRFSPMARNQTIGERFFFFNAPIAIVVLAKDRTNGILAAQNMDCLLYTSRCV